MFVKLTTDFFVITVQIKKNSKTCVNTDKNLFQLYAKLKPASNTLVAAKLQ